MSRSLTHIATLGLVALIAACSQPRKAAERDCRKADKWLAKAVWLCPDIMTRDSASVTLSLPGDSATVRIGYADPMVDSLLRACEQFAAAVAMDAELLQRTLDQDSITIAQLELRLAALQRAEATASIRRSACRFEPIEETVGLCTVRVQPGTNGPLVTVEQAPLDTTLRSLCPPQVQRPPCPTCPDGVATWWRTLALVLAALLLITNLKRLLGFIASVAGWPRLYING